jgi:hypothetical protein
VLPVKREPGIERHQIRFPQLFVVWMLGEGKASAREWVLPKVFASLVLANG